MLSDFKEERKREQNETKQQQQQKQTNETNALGARIFSVSYLLSSSEAPLSREQRAQGAMGRHNVRRVIAAPTFHGWILIWNMSSRSKIYGGLLNKSETCLPHMFFWVVVREVAIFFYGEQKP